MIKKLVVLGGLAALAKYFFDPQEGPARRAQVAQKIEGMSKGSQPAPGGSV